MIKKRIKMTTTEYSDDMTSLTSTSCEEILPATIGGGDGLKAKFIGNILDTRHVDKRLNRKSKKITKIGINSKNSKTPGTPAIKSKTPGIRAIKSKTPSRPSLNTNKSLEKNIIRNKILNKKILNEKLDKSIIKNPKIIIKAKEDKDITEYMSPIKQYNSKKSHSQMDMNQVRSSSSRRSRQCEYIPSCYSLKSVINDGENQFDRTIELNDDYQFYFSKHTENGTYDNKLAGMKIFATIMLNAWRRRRDDVKRLNEELGKSKKGQIKIKTQIHVLNSLFKIEQKQNDELNSRIRKLVDEHHQLQNLYDRLNIRTLELKSRNADLEEKMFLKDKEFDGLQAALTETKNRLYISMQNENDLCSALATEKRLNQDLDCKRSELLDIISELKCLLFQKSASLQENNLEHEDEIKELKECIAKLEEDVIKYRGKEMELLKLESFNDNQKKVIDELNGKVALLQYKIDSYLPNRIKRLLINTLPACLVRYLHITAYYLLPAVPPPKKDNLPKIIGLQKISCMWKK